MIQTTLLPRVLGKYMNPYFVETGTADGDCVRLALEMNFEKIFSIELDQSLQDKNIQIFKQFTDNGKLELITGDSLLEIPRIVSKLDKPTTFWLDAHVDFGPMGINKCPLYEEIKAIKQSKIKTHTILIDDVRIFGQHWGEDISLLTIKNSILEINPDYKFTFEDNTYANNDVLVAYL